LRAGIEIAAAPLVVDRKCLLGRRARPINSIQFLEQKRFALDM